MAVATALLALFLFAVRPATPHATSTQRTKKPALSQLVGYLVRQAYALGAVARVQTRAAAWAASAGLQDLASRKAMATRVRFRVGSTTKTFTAVVALQLVGEHKLQLTDTVEQWLPGLVPLGSRITVLELLNHTSGLFNYTRDRGVRETWGTDQVPTPRQLVSIAAGHGLDFDPGTGWEYSNTNYQVLGLLIERISGHSLAGELQRRIIRPLALRDTALVPGRDIPGPHAQGYYVYREKPPLNVTRITFGSWADGALVSSVRDLARFYSTLFRGKLLAKKEMQELKSTVETGGFPDGDRAGLGIFRTNLSCGAAWGHSGGVAGFLTKVLVSGDGRRVVVVGTNGFLDEGPETQSALDSGAAAAFCSR